MGSNVCMEVHVRTSAVARIGLMALLMMGLAIPLVMLFGLVAERAGRRERAVEEVSAQWGGPQTVAGPVMALEIRATRTGADGKPVVTHERLGFLPVALDVQSEIAPEVRRRGLFEAIVYRSKLRLTGRFAPPDLSAWHGAGTNMIVTGAALSIALSDPRGIAGPISLVWNGTGQTFAPGAPDLALGMPGVSAHLPIPETAADIPFAITLDVNGTRELKFVPTGNDTSVQVNSPWPHPSFLGAPLPGRRDVKSTGFTARWDVPNYGRGFPSSWTVSGVNGEQFKNAVARSAVGVALIRPVDIYQQSERAVKYAVLFITMTFVVAFLWEVVYGTLVHPVQYIFVGFAMCLFYLLLLALSEHIGFDKAYVSAALAVVGLIAWYWNWVIRGGVRHAVLMGGVLAALYGYLYLLLRLEDYALVSGAIGLFLMLTVVMFLTRRIDWYTLRLGREDTTPGSGSGEA